MSSMIRAVQAGRRIRTPLYSIQQPGPHAPMTVTVYPPLDQRE